MAKCEFTKTDGKKCKAYAMTNSDFCLSHNPKAKHLKAEAVRNGGLARRRPKLKLKPLEGLDNPKGIIRLLTEAINYVRSDKMSSKTANTIGYLAEKLTKVLEVSEYETRMKQIEKILDQRQTYGR